MKAVLMFDENFRRAKKEMKGYPAFRPALDLPGLISAMIDVRAAGTRHPPGRGATQGAARSDGKGAAFRDFREEESPRLPVVRVEIDSHSFLLWRDQDRDPRWGDGRAGTLPGRAGWSGSARAW
ncbi:hypothetical protein VSR68_30435 [Paraburkholderia phymatum]|uniref:hypothetical protein n=1 Tax=Paraburkholderia phymatum TaxID=148447 RepID=UPI00317554B8